jgi:CRISPR-associated endonuclease/helicase Cas3
MTERGNGAAALLAHIERDSATGTWRKQPLEEHLRGTAQLAAEFARPFGGADWAFLAGLWHDLGKAQPNWQRYIRSVTGYEPGGPARGPHHSIVGASHATDKLDRLRGRILAYVIAGHHAGLADWSSADGGEAALSIQLQRRELLEAALASGALTTDLLGSPGPKGGMPAGTEEALHVFIRMLFSCLVDADSIDTEGFSSPDKRSRRGCWPNLDDIESQLVTKVANLPHGGAVNEVRWQVRDEVMTHATDAPGFFSLTVPTGGGKTLTSLSFALAHARANGLRRVIYAIPYLSIIEQTAETFREYLGKDAVLEHHSNLDPDVADERGLLAAENWDAPVVVTTTVQLFESLFAAKRSRCRKLHNIPGSVIVLDEAQLLPPDFLEPILSLLRVLVAGYGVSVVLCTATQPVLASADRSGRKFKGLDGVRELVRDPGHLFTQLDRVSVEWPSDMRAGSSWEDMAAKLLKERQVVCVVNTRADARALSALVPDSLHLSASMCAEHRAKKLADIKAQLKAGVEVRVVSTQLIEAGVDIDFPVVYRALAGLDSIAQSAGRCNREGKLGQGRVVVFVPPKPSPKGHLLQGEQATRSLMAASQAAPMLLRPEDFRRYFELLYGTLPTLDRGGIMPLLTAGARDAEMSLRTAAGKFQMIDDAGTTTVLVPYGRGAGLIRRLVRLGQPDRLLLRRLQRFSVVLHEREFKSLLAVGGAREIVAGIYAVEPDRYDDRLGVVVGEASIATELVG